ncbi:putative phosphatidate phosphatase [Zerene cesonia]|uniref:putative phosphatidate phosphatase n=1 Tax=Zerene cesonia TaxID=33412 RepID=UPI0018E550A7|nr:putative phosphatidate phosphatase [Zerene cesonia]
MSSTCDQTQRAAYTSAEATQHHSQRPKLLVHVDAQLGGRDSHHEEFEAHFIYPLCKPVPINTVADHSFITEFRCTGADATASNMKDMRLSFPSAHSGFAMYCAVFFIFYIQVKAKWRGSKLLRHVAQYAVLMAAWYVGLSRVVDHMHHWSDVAVGFAVGAAFAALTFIYVYAPNKRIRRESWITEPSTQPEMLPRPVLMTHSN